MFSLRRQGRDLDCDYDASDYGYPEDGIVHDLHCENCGAFIQYVIFANQEGDEK